MCHGQEEAVWPPAVLAISPVFRSLTSKMSFSNAIAIGQVILLEARNTIFKIVGQ